MRIDHLIYLLHKKGPESFRNPKAILEMQDEAPDQGTAFEDVVQLRLGSDGVWDVGASPAFSPSTFRTSPQAPSAGVPHIARLYHSLLRVYSAAGIAGGMANAPRGLLIDVYT